MITIACRAGGRGKSPLLKDLTYSLLASSNCFAALILGDVFEYLGIELTQGTDYATIRFLLYGGWTEERFSGLTVQIFCFDDQMA